MTSAGDLADCPDRSSAERRLGSRATPAAPTAAREARRALGLERAQPRTVERRRSSCRAAQASAHARHRGRLREVAKGRRLQDDPSEQTAPPAARRAGPSPTARPPTARRPSPGRGRRRTPRCSRAPSERGDLVEQAPVAAAPAAADRSQPAEAAEPVVHRTITEVDGRRRAANRGTGSRRHGRSRSHHRGARPSPAARPRARA